MLRGVLSDAGCQLIRLGLAGNALGDAGIVALSAGLQVSNNSCRTLLLSLSSSFSLYLIGGQILC